MGVGAGHETGKKKNEGILSVYETWLAIMYSRIKNLETKKLVIFVSKQRVQNKL
jgi:hypothetical protein